MILTCYFGQFELETGKLLLLVNLKGSQVARRKEMVPAWLRDVTTAARSSDVSRLAEL